MANPRIRFALGSHVRFGNLDFICTGVDYDLVLLPTIIDIDAISETLSNLHLGTDEGQAPENDRPGGSQGQTTLAGKPHDHGRARGQSSTAIRFDPFAGEIPADLPTHHAQAIAEVLVTTEIASNIGSDQDDSSWASADFSGLNDLGALRRFIDVCDYLIDNGDSDDDDYELTWP
jgi:hypothetical protein